ncbi:hypothetical protein FRB90_012278, partial [Tulasnella sp. 427]
MATAFNEKGSAVPPTLVTPPAPSSSASSSFLSTIASPITGLATRFGSWKAGFNLPNPGTAENLQKEVK